jgi:hypothetical protein
VPLPRHDIDDIDLFFLQGVPDHDDFEGLTKLESQRGLFGSSVEAQLIVPADVANCGQLSHNGSDLVAGSSATLTAGEHVVFTPFDEPCDFILEYTVRDALGAEGLASGRVHFFVRAEAPALVQVVAADPSTVATSDGMTVGDFIVFTFDAPTSRPDASNTENFLEVFEVHDGSVGEGAHISGCWSDDGRSLVARVMEPLSLLDLEYASFSLRPGVLRGINGSTTFNGPTNVANATRLSGSFNERLCLEGAFFDSTASQCVPCSLGERLSDAGDGCVDCAPGRYGRLSSSGAATCAACEPGAYDDEPGLIQCNDCQPGRWSEQSGAIECALCPPGRYGQLSSSGAATCAACEPGEYNDEPGMTQCKHCQPGRFSKQSGAIQCSFCEIGYFQTSSNQARCERCPKGAFANASGSSSCRLCPAGMTTDGTGFGDVMACTCPLGFYSDLDSGNHCVACDEGAVCLGFGELPRAEPGYQLKELLDEGLSIYSCFGDTNRCPGGLVGDCAVGREGVACAACKEGMTPGELGICTLCEGSDTAPFVIFLLTVAMILAVAYVKVATEDRARQSNGTFLLTMTTAQVIAVVQLLGVTARLSVIWVEPILSFMRVLKIFNFEVELLRLNCVSHVSALGVYTAKLMMVPSAVVFLALVHSVWMLVCHRGHIAAKTPLLIGACGMFVMGLFITISLTILSPFQCQRHPNGKWTTLQYQDTTCWDSPEHTTMIVLGTLASFIPISFLALVVHLLKVFPLRMARGDVQFLNTYAFLFFRVKPAARWFVLAFLVRNMIIAMVPVIPNVFWQVTIMQIMFIVTFGVTCIVMPWRWPIANALEIVTAGCMLCLFCLTAFFVRDPNLQGVAEVAVVALLGSFIFLPIVAAFAMLKRHLFKTKKSFQYFLCHHKAAAGTFARLTKICLADSAHVSTSRIFLDSDNLTDLESLFDTVSGEVGTLVVLSSREVLLRPWCLGEVTTCYLHKVPMFPVYFPDFTPPSDLLIKDIDTEVDFTVLSEAGISADSARAALMHFRELPHVSVDVLSKPLSLGTMMSLCNQITSGSTDDAAACADRRPSLGSDADAKAVILADFEDSEAAAACLVFQKLLIHVLQGHLEKVPILFQDFADALLKDLNAPGTDKCTTLLLFCTGSCFSSQKFLRGLMWCVWRQFAHVVPVAVADTFRFPTPSFYVELENNIAKLFMTSNIEADPSCLSNYVAAIFKKIALSFSTMGDIQTLKSQTRTIWQRTQEASAKIDMALMVKDDTMMQALFSGTANCYSRVAPQRETDDFNSDLVDRRPPFPGTSEEAQAAGRGTLGGRTRTKISLPVLVTLRPPGKSPSSCPSLVSPSPC